MAVYWARVVAVDLGWLPRFAAPGIISAMNFAKGPTVSVVADAEDADGKRTAINGWRFYRFPRNRPMLLAFALGEGGVFGAVAGSSFASGDMGVGEFVAFVVLGLIVFGGCVYGAFRIGVQESEDGLASLRNYRRSRIAWEDVRDIRAASRPIGRLYPVVVKRADGRSVVISVVQGRRVVWDGGSTNDIVSVLTDRVNEVRTARGLAPIDSQPAAP